MANLTLYDVTTRNKNDALTGCVEDVTIFAPEFTVVPTVIRTGTKYDTLSRVGLPSVGFRLANQEISSSKSVYKKTTHEMFPLDGPITIDEVVYKADDGATGDLMMRESTGIYQGMINFVGNQFYYGTSTDGSNGFVGVRAQLLSNLQTNPTATAVTASNSTNSTTAYGLWLDTQGVQFNIGNNGIISFPQFIRQRVGGINTGLFAWVSNIQFFIGLGVASAESVFGITGINYANPLTDNLGAQLMETVPLNRRPGFKWFMNRRAHTTLQLSRSSIKNQPSLPASGAPAFSGPPLALDGKEIVLTDSITNTEDNR